MPRFSQTQCAVSGSKRVPAAVRLAARLRQFLSRALALGLVSVLILSATGCSRRPPAISLTSDAPVLRPEKRGGQIAEVSPPTVIPVLRQALTGYQPQVRIVSPKPNETVESDRLEVRLNVADLPLFKDPQLGLGPNLEVFLDDQPYQSVFSIDEPLVFEGLSAGSHTLRVLAAQPWGESFKNDGAYAQTTFHVFTQTKGPDPELPLLTYASPQGTYGAEPILLDYFVSNAPLHLVAEDEAEVSDWKIRCTINGESFALDRWQPIYLKGFNKGKNWIKLEYLDESGQLVENVFNTGVRIIDYRPGGEDALSKLVRDRLPVETAMAMVKPGGTPVLETATNNEEPVPAPEDTDALQESDEPASDSAVPDISLEELENPDPSTEAQGDAAEELEADSIKAVPIPLPATGEDVKDAIAPQPAQKDESRGGFFSRFRKPKDETDNVDLTPAAEQLEEPLQENSGATEIQAEQAQAAEQQAEAERLEAERLEVERLVAEKAEAERLEAERIAAEKAEAERIAAEKAEAERQEAERIAAEKAEAERVAAEQAEAERVRAAEAKAEAKRLAAEQAEAERIEAERLEAERLQAEQERLAAEKAEAERIAAEKAEAERIKAEQAEAERAKRERLRAEQKAEQARLRAERKAERERLKQERAEQRRVEKEKAAQEKVERRRAQQEKAEQEKAARLEAEQERAKQLEAERAAAQPQESPSALEPAIPAIPTQLSAPGTTEGAIPAAPVSPAPEAESSGGFFSRFRRSDVKTLDESRRAVAPPAAPALSTASDDETAEASVEKVESTEATQAMDTPAESKPSTPKEKKSPFWKVFAPPAPPATVELPDFDNAFDTFEQELEEAEPEAEVQEQASEVFGDRPAEADLEATEVFGL